MFHADVQQTVLMQNKAPEEQRSGVDQQDPESLNIKKEEEELCTSLEVEEFTVKRETDDTEFALAAVPLEGEDDEGKPLFSQLPQHQAGDGDLPTSRSANQKKEAADGEDCGGAETSGLPERTATYNEGERVCLKKKKQQKKVMEAVSNPKDGPHRLGLYNVTCSNFYEFNEFI